MNHDRTRARFWRTAWLLFLSAIGVPAHGQEPEAKLPSFAQLREGWNTLAPKGRTSCALEPDYRFFVRRAAPERLLVYFEGGGACWDGATCDPDRPDRAYRREIRGPVWSGGIFNFLHPENPFAGYSIVVVTYCTGDVHLGDRDTTYTIQQPAGTRTLAIRHRGQVNALSVLRWIQANFPAPREIFVAGSSAGAVAAPFYGSLLARHYSQARVTALADAAGAYRGTGTLDGGRWGIPEVLRRHPGWEQYEPGPGVAGLYPNAAHAAPRLKLYQFDHADDQTQRRYRILGGEPDPHILELLRANRRDIAAALPGFRSFTAGGPLHGVLIDDRFYSERVGRYRLRDWVAALARGDTVPNVHCTACERPEFSFSDSDVKLVERAIELVSEPGKWRSVDPPGPCADQATDRVSVRCALVTAHQQLTGETLRGMQNLPPAFLEVLFTVAAQLNDPMLRGEPLRDYNNRTGTTVEGIVALLQEVRSRMRAELSSR